MEKDNEKNCDYVDGFRVDAGCVANERYYTC